VKSNFKILRMQSPDQSIISLMDEIKNAIVDHFQNHFSARGVRPVPNNMNSKRINSVDSEDLVREYLEEEVLRAV